jgi:replicative DNA helicase
MLEQDDVVGFLGSIMLDSGIIHETRIRPDMFGEHSVYARIFKILESQVYAKIKPDFKTVWLALKDSQGMPFQVQDAQEFLQTISREVASPVNWKHHESRIIDEWAKSKIQATCSMVAEMTGPSFKAADFVEHIEKAIAEINLIDTGYEIKSIRDMVPEIVDLISERSKNKNKLIGISTGLPELDAHTYGMQEGAFWVIGGRPSDGKSALMGQVHRNVSIRIKTPCGVITVESSNRELGMRSFSAESRIPSSAINTGNLKPGDFTTIQDTASEFYDLDDRILYYDRPGIDIREVKSTARRMVKRNKAKVIFLDYLQLIRVENCKNKFEEVARVTTELKGLARDLKVCIVALAQLKRESENRRPELGDFQYSSQIEQDADVALMLWHVKEAHEIIQPDKSVLTTETVNSYIIVGKARDGLTGDIPVIFDKPILTFKEKEKNPGRYE